MRVVNEPAGTLISQNSLAGDFEVTLGIVFSQLSGLAVWRKHKGERQLRSNVSLDFKICSIPSSPIHRDTMFYRRGPLGRDIVQIIATTIAHPSFNADAMRFTVEENSNHNNARSPAWSHLPIASILRPFLALPERNLGIMEI